MRGNPKLQLWNESTNFVEQKRQTRKNCKPEIKYYKYHFLSPTLNTDTHSTHNNTHTT